MTLWLLLVGCRHAQPVKLPVDDRSPLETYAAPPRELEWHEHVAIGPMEISDVVVRQTWDGPSLDREHQQVIFDVTETQVDESGEHVRAKTRVFYDGDGFGYLGAWDKDGGKETYYPYEPKELVFPGDATPGEEWQSYHLRGGVVLDRECDLMPSNLCEGGLTSVCESDVGKKEDGTLSRQIMRDHFCPGVGWAGYEALELSQDREVRYWSDDLKRDGVPVTLKPPKKDGT